MNADVDMLAVVKGVQALRGSEGKPPPSCELVNLIHLHRLC